MIFSVPYPEKVKICENTWSAKSGKLRIKVLILEVFTVFKLLYGSRSTLMALDKGKIT